MVLGGRMCYESMKKPSRNSLSLRDVDGLIQFIGFGGGMRSTKCHSCSQGDLYFAIFTGNNAKAMILFFNQAYLGGEYL